MPRKPKSPPSPKRKTKSATDGLAKGAVVKGEVKPKPEGYVFGRPTSYRPEYCEQVVQWGREGKSRTWMAANLGIDRRTIDTWATVNPDFFVALSHAKALEQAFWEDLGFSGLSADKFHAGVWTKSMAARFPDEWRDSQNVAATHSGNLAHSHSIEFHVVDPNQDQG